MADNCPHCHKHLKLEIGGTCSNCQRYVEVIAPVKIPVKIPVKPPFTNIFINKNDLSKLLYTLHKESKTTIPEARDKSFISRATIHNWLKRSTNPTFFKINDYVKAHGFKIMFVKDNDKD